MQSYPLTTSKTLLNHFLLKPLMGLHPYTLHACMNTHTQNYTNLRNVQNHNNEWIDQYQTTLYKDRLKRKIIYMHTQHYTCVDMLPEENIA